MNKRKLSGGAAASPAKVAAAAEKKNVEQEEDPYAPGPIDVDPLKFLIAPKEISAFMSESWERAPLHIPANDERKEFFDGLFNLDALAKVSDQLEAGTLLLMDQDPGPKGDSLSLDDDVDDLMVRTVGPLMFGRDVVAVRYIDGKRETISGDIADSDTLRKLHNLAGATLQLHQPQRFINGLWRLVAALEAQAGCLVGCNAYVTPKNGQGLAPHHDDVELFVCQTQGSKKWLLYKPSNGFELPSSSSGDLPQEGLGEPILEVTMQPGDVLYLPRGTIHQAVAQEEGSCHLTISTYQHWTLGDLAETVIETARASNGDQRSALPLELRKGLPLGLIFQHGLQADVQAADPAAAARPAASALAAGLRALAAQLESGPAELLTPAVDNFAIDFLRNRLPPHPCQLPDESEEPNLGDSLVCRGKNLFRLLPVELPGGGVSELDEDEDEENGEKRKGKEDTEGGKKEAHVKLVTCIFNNRYTHMISSSAAGMEDEESDEDDEHGGDLCGAGCGHDHDEEEEEEEEEEEKEEEEKEEAGKKGGVKKGGKKAAEEEEEAKEGEEGGNKKGGKKKAAEQKVGKEAKEEEGEEPEIMEVSEEEDVELVAGEGEDEEDEDEEGDEDEEEEDEEDEEEDGLQGPIFPAQYAVVLADVLAATTDRPLPIKQLRVPGGDAQEQLRLARVLHDFGAVIVVPGEKKSEDKEEAKGKAEKKGEDSAKKGKANEKGEETEGEKKGGKKGKAEEAKGGSPPAKKAKKGGN